MKIIGIGHRALQGKTTFAYALAKEFGPLAGRVIVYNFSDDICTIARFLGLMKEEKDNNLLQLLGTLYRQKVSKEVWISFLQAKVTQDEPDIAIVTGIRFLNEANWIISSDFTEGGKDGILIKLERMFEDGTVFRDKTRNLDHISEHELSDFTGWDYTVRVPSGNLPQLYADAKNLVEVLSKRWGLGNA